MGCSIVNEVYRKGCNVSNSVIVAVKPIVNKTIDVSKRIFATSAGFVVGFCFGGIAAFGFMLSQPHTPWYALDMRIATIFAFLAGIAGGCALASEAWKASTKVWNLPFTYEQVMAEANAQFSNNPFKNEILKIIKGKLELYKQNGEITLGGATVNYYSDAAMEGLEAFFDRKDLFPGLELNTLGGSILGRKELVKGLMGQAEIFVANIPEPDRRKELLNYIRNIVYRHQFARTPKPYIGKWKLETSQIDQFPQNRALEFFQSNLR